MAANTNLPQPQSAIALPKSTVEQLMPEFPTPLDDSKTYDTSSRGAQTLRRKEFRERLQACLDAYPTIESTARMLPAFWAHFQVTLGADESLAQDAALLTAYMGTEPGTTWAPNVNPIVQSTFCSIVTLSRLPLVQDWAWTHGRKLLMAKNWAEITKLANQFSKMLHPIMEDSVSITGKQLTPPYRLFRAILADKPFMHIASPRPRIRKFMKKVVKPLYKHLDTMSCMDKLSVELKKDIETIESLLRSPRYGDTATRKECEVVIQSWNSLGNLKTGGGPTPDTNIPLLPLPSNAFPHRDSTVATPSEFTSTAPAPAPTPGSSSQSLVSPWNTMPTQRVAAAANLHSRSNATPPMATTRAAAKEFTSTAATSTLRSGTSSQSMLYSASQSALPPQRVPDIEYLTSYANATPQRESTVTAPPRFPSTTPVPTFGLGASSQSLLYYEDITPQHRVLGAVYLTSYANATPQTGSTVSAPGRFPSTAPASTLGLGTSTQSPLYPTNTIPQQGFPDAAYPPPSFNSMSPMATTTRAPMFANTHPAIGTSATPFRNSHSTIDMSAMDASDMDITATWFGNPDSTMDMSATWFGNPDSTMDMSGISALDMDISAVLASVLIMPATPFENTPPTMGMSATSIAASGALSTPRPLTQSMGNPSDTITDPDPAIPADPASSNTENPPPSSDMPVEHSEKITVQKFLSMTAEEFNATLEDTSAPEYMGHDSFGL